MLVAESVNGSKHSWSAEVISGKVRVKGDARDPITLVGVPQDLSIPYPYSPTPA